MILEVLPYELTVCRLESADDINTRDGFFFAARTDEEVSLVCETRLTPARTTHRADGWRGFRVSGMLDFSLTGILSRLSGVLADAGIGIFAVSTFNTDYILVKAENLESAVACLRAAGYEFVI